MGMWLVAAKLELAGKQNRVIMRHKYVDTDGVRYFLIHQNDLDPRERG